MTTFNNQYLTNNFINMWIFIIIIALILIFGIRLSIKSLIGNKVSSKGGMLKLYKELIDEFTTDPRSSILKITDNSVMVGLTTIDGSTLIRIVQLYDRIQIQWKLQSFTFGNEILRWEFPDGLDQQIIIKTINDHVRQKNIQMLQNDIKRKLGEVEYNKLISENPNFLELYFSKSGKVNSEDGPNDSDDEYPF